MVGMPLGKRALWAGFPFWSPLRAEPKPMASSISCETKAMRSYLLGRCGPLLAQAHLRTRNVSRAGNFVRDEIRKRTTDVARLGRSQCDRGLPSNHGNSTSQVRTFVNDKLLRTLSDRSNRPRVTASMRASKGSVISATLPGGVNLNHFDRAQ